MSTYSSVAPPARCCGCISNNWALPPTARIFRDTTASSPPVGEFYYGGYHTLVVAPATSNTVAKFVFGISDTLATNVFAQAGKCRVPSIVFACDTRARTRDRGAEGHVKVYPRPDRSRQHGTVEGFRSDRRRRNTRPTHGRDRAPPAGVGGMIERVLFLTGHLARPRLERVLSEIKRPDFEWAALDIGVKVAALMTEAIIANRLPRPVHASRVVVPGRCRADLAALSIEFGVRFERGPDELKDLPAFLGARARGVDLSRHEMRIFAEIVDASSLSVEKIIVRARAMAAAGADVDRSRLFARYAVSSSRGQRRRREERRSSRQRRFGGARRTEAGRAGGRRFPAQPEGGIAGRRRGKRRATPILIPSTHGDLDSLARAAKSRNDAESGASSTRFSIRSISVSRPRSRATSSSAGACRGRKF